MSWLDVLDNPGLPYRVLFIMPDSSAEVKKVREKGVEAYGCTISGQGSGEWTYEKPLEDIHFPTDYFQHVIFEGYENIQQSTLDEIFRITTQEKTCYIECQQEKMLKKAGFGMVGTVQPDGKFISIVRKPTQNRSKLLLPPGVGDVYWPLVKTQSLLKREGIKPPVDTYIVAPRAKKYDSHARAFPFLEMFPFLHSTGEMKFAKGDPVWKEAYLQQGRTVFRNIQGCDLFITWNGYLRAGKSLERVDPDLKCNWDLPRFVSFHEENYRRESIAKYGDYLVLYWVFQGSNAMMLKRFSVEMIAESINRIIANTGLAPVIVGAVWDTEDEYTRKLIKMLPKNTVDLRGQTSLEEVFGLIRGSKGVVGMNSGITIMSGVFGVKTILLYHEYFTTRGVKRNFAWNTFPPETRERTYFAEFAQDITGEGFTARCLSVLNDTPYVEQKEYFRKPGQKNKMPKIRAKESHATIRDIVESKPKPKPKPKLEPKPEPTTSPEVAIICVLRSGGPYDERYVEHLQQGVERHLTVKHKFVVLTDMMQSRPSCEVVPLRHNWPGWLSKLELFRGDIAPGMQKVYFDLDTVIVGNIDRLAMHKHRLTMLRPFNPARRESWTGGVMAWGQDMSRIYERFRTLYETDPPPPRDPDYKYILGYCDCTPEYINDIQPGIYSYKWHCRDRGVRPRNSTIICFHGNPRPHEIGWRI